MAIKTITVTEEAYRAIRRLKHENESFSELFKRIGGAPLKIKDIVGVLKMSPEELEAWSQRVLQLRQEMGKGLEKRMEDVRTRLKHLDRSLRARTQGKTSQ